MLRRALATFTLAIGWLGLAAHVAFSASAIARAHVDVAGTTLNVTLLAVEGALGAFGLLLFGALVDAPAPPPARVPLPDPAPRVTLVVPVYREDPRVLEETLAAVQRLQWPRDRLDVRVVDDTPEDADAARLARVSAEAGVTYVRRRARRGYKAGALNDALAATRGDVVAVLDVDHVPEPDWLTRAVPVLLADARAAYVQGRLAWRNADAPIRRLQALLQAHFFDVIQRAKAPRGAAVFAGSGAVFRRAALEDAGGFPEDTLVEDFDATVALLARGWRGVYDPHVVARGLLPWTSADLARQLWRWAHGTTRILVARAPRVLDPRATKRAARGMRAGWRTRFECMTDAAAYTGAGLFPVAGALLALAATTGTPLPRSAPGSLLLGPGLVLAAHSVTAAVALHRAGERGRRWIPAYHVMSIAFTPIVFAATLAAYANVGGRAEGRVSKDPATARAHPARGPRSAALIAGALGVTLLAAATPLAFDLHEAAARVWAGGLGVAFVAPLVVGVVEGRD